MSRVQWMAALVAVGGLSELALSEITSFSGAASARLEEIRNGVSGDLDTASDGFPSTDALPLQVVARLISADPNQEPAAAVVGAQFADPTTLAQPNPEEFAINLTLNSVAPNIRYIAQARSSETRGVLFSAGELGPASADGDVESLVGTLFIDGALTILAGPSGVDLTGARVDLHVTVEQLNSDETHATDFDGTLSLVGLPDGRVRVEAGGEFPTQALVLTDLSPLATDFGVLQVLIIPSIEIEYNFAAVVGQPLDLVATVQVDAQNLPGGVGVAAMLGTPTDSLLEVISLTNSEEAATKVLNLLQRERDDPSGAPAFPSPAPFGLFGLCGLFGIESLFGLVALGGLRAACRRGFRVA